MTEGIGLTQKLSIVAPQSGGINAPALAASTINRLRHPNHHSFQIVRSGHTNSESGDVRPAVENTSGQPDC